GLVLVRDGQIERGVEVLRRAVGDHPESEEAWEGLLTGLDDAALATEFIEAMDGLPTRLSDRPRLARLVGRADELRGRWPEAATAYIRALEFDPGDLTTRVRAARVLQQIHRQEEATHYQ